MRVSSIVRKARIRFCSTLARIVRAAIAASTLCATARSASWNTLVKSVRGRATVRDAMLLR